MSLQADARCSQDSAIFVSLQNTYPEKINTWRHVVYTCYQPRGMASARDLELKAQAWERYQITTHLPAENIRVYDENFAERTSPACPQAQRSC